MSPRFKLDENMPADAEIWLRGGGYDVETASSDRLGGAVDSVVLNACRLASRVLITLDLDFADIRNYPPDSHHGIWVLRPLRQTVRDIVTVLRGALNLLATESPDRRLWIVESERVRIRE
jgi:predicted nuclease of predicted toxin-antitoxin system